MARLTHKGTATAALLASVAVALSACGTDEPAETGFTNAALPSKDSGPPNFVFLMTDDQEVASVDFMPTVKREISRKGVTFKNAFVSYPLCCPARASFQTGQYAHNHGVLDNRPPKGGYPAFEAGETLPVWLGRAGYETAYIGKYMNDYTKDDDIPPGWDRWFGMVEPSSRYFKVHVNDQGTFTKFGKTDPKDYSTDLFTDRAVNFIEGRKDDGPFLPLGRIRGAPCREVVPGRWPLRGQGT